MIYFVTFSNAHYARARQRIAHEARALGRFDHILPLGENDLEGSYLSRYGSFIQENPRGYGYWIWKSYCIKTVLDRLSIDDILVYADAGCAINYSNKSRFDEYVEYVKESELGIVCFKNGYIEKNWVKGDLIDFMGCRGRRDILESEQIMGGILIIQKNPKSSLVINQWYESVHENLRLVDDTPSKSPNEEGFIEHRHDQSFLSLILKMTGGAKVLPSTDVEVPVKDRKGGWMPYWKYRRNVFLAIRDVDGVIYNTSTVATFSRNCLSVIICALKGLKHIIYHSLLLDTNGAI